MDPISLFMAATAAFNTVKKLVEAGREVEDVLGQIGSWMGKVSELNALDNKKPSIFKRIGSGKSVEQEAMEQLQQLAFDSEDAAINEQKAALELEKARETLARVSDLPPNSRARKEAELAFAQADLNYRRAIDKNNDLKKTEAKNAQMGNGTIQAQIEGQDSVISALIV